MMRRPILPVRSRAYANREHHPFTDSVDVEMLFDAWGVDRGRAEWCEIE